MANIQDIKNILNRIPPMMMSETKKKDIISKSDIYFELRTFVMNKYGIDESSAETKFQDFYKDKIVKPSITYIIDSVIDYSLSEGFDKHEELVSNTNSIKKSLGLLLYLYK